MKDTQNNTEYGLIRENNPKYRALYKQMIAENRAQKKNNQTSGSFMGCNYVTTIILDMYHIPYIYTEVIT